MENKNLLKRLGKLGFQLFETDEELKTNETISEVVQSENIRLWEGFPIIFANANKENLFSYGDVKNFLKNKKELGVFASLILMSLGLYKFLELKFVWEKELLKDFNLEGINKISEFQKNFEDNTGFRISEKEIDPQRVKQLFNNYFITEESEIKKIDAMHSELSLEYALSQLFTPKQKEIFLKRLQGNKLSKTEREYFYRVVKKKALALVNQDLQRLAQQIIR